MEGEGLANAAVAIRSGPDVAQGSAFQPVKLEKRKITEAGKVGEKFKKFAGGSLEPDPNELDLPTIENSEQMSSRVG